MKRKKRSSFRNVPFKSQLCGVVSAGLHHGVADIIAGVFSPVLHPKQRWFSRPAPTWCKRYVNVPVPICVLVDSFFQKRGTVRCFSTETGSVSNGIRLIFPCLLSPSFRGGPGPGGGGGGGGRISLRGTRPNTPMTPKVNAHAHINRLRPPLLSILSEPAWRLICSHRTLLLSAVLRTHTRGCKENYLSISPHNKKCLGSKSSCLHTHC